MLRGASMAAIKPKELDLQTELQEKARLFFDPQLAALGLGREQIQEQTVAELEDSLVRVNDALKNADSFGVLRLKVTATASVILSTGMESQFEVGVMPLLLDRKKLIMDRLRQLRGERKVNTLQDLILTVPEDDLRDRLLVEYEARAAVVTKSEQGAAIRKGLAFVAMAMDVQNPELEDILDAIKAGATACQVIAERVDEAQSNERITDRTLDSIGQAEFVIVDLTYDRPNVYYEAGYAQALKKTPIYLAKEGTAIHFDVKDYPVIFYSNMRSLRSSLAERLTAIIFGRTNKH
jgi:hypothetical protein